MVANALILSIAAMLALAFSLMQELRFLVPYKAILLHQYGTVILAYAAVTFLNIFATTFALNRRFFLKDTGRKLSHLDKQFNIGHADLPAPSREEDVN
jgi:hypothetical protein